MPHITALSGHWHILYDHQEARASPWACVLARIPPWNSAVYCRPSGRDGIWNTGRWRQLGIYRQQSYSEKMTFRETPLWHPAHRCCTSSSLVSMEQLTHDHGTWLTLTSRRCLAAVQWCRSAGIIPSGFQFAGRFPVIISDWLSAVLEAIPFLSRALRFIFVCVGEDKEDPSIKKLSFLDWPHKGILRRSTRDVGVQGDLLLQGIPLLRSAIAYRFSALSAGDENFISLDPMTKLSWRGIACCRPHPAHATPGCNNN